MSLGHSPLEENDIEPRMSNVICSLCEDVAAGKNLQDNISSLVDTRFAEESMVIIDTASLDNRFPRKHLVSFLPMEAVGADGRAWTGCFRRG